MIIDETRLLDFLTGKGFRPPREALARAHLVVTDVLCAAAAGSAIPDVQAAVGALVADPGPCTLIGCGRTVSPGQAAMVNTVLAIAQETEEGHNTAGHVGAATVAGALAAAEEVGADGASLLDAVLRAYEVCARVERLMMPAKARTSAATSWIIRNPHSTWTAVGPALAAALLWRLDREALRAAWRLATNLAVLSLWDPFVEGSLSRNLTAGLSAQAALSAARLAQAGMEGSAEALWGIYTPLRAETGPESFDRWFASLGQTYEITRGYFKPYPSCRYTHPPLDALRSIGDDVTPEAVERIEVHTFGAAAPFAHQRAPTSTSAKFSIPFVLAAYLVLGRVDFESFSEASLCDARIQGLARRVVIRVDEEIEARFPHQWGARVVVSLRDGRTLTGEVADPLGGPQRPLAGGELRARHRAALEQRFDPSQTEAVAAALDRLPGMASVRSLGEVLRGAGT
ncbi:MAG: MmgE/PrpD family protein [Armatimonadota bacterium]|nr:MmgE/PrpD family protein [Armatimonadota bacterium]